MKKILLFIVLLVLIAFSILQHLLGSKKIEKDKSVEQIPTIEKVLPTYSVKGIDISKHNGEVNWKVLKEKNDLAFVFTKATEGNSYLDSMLTKNLNGANGQDVLVGAYHFFSLCVDGTSQANWYIKNVDREKINLPPVVDLELYRNCKPGNYKPEIEIQKYLDTVEKFYKTKPIIYTTIDFYGEYGNKIDLIKYPLWVRIVDRHIDDREKENIFGLDNETEIREIFRNNWTFWQATDVGKVEGIKGDVDINYYRYDLEELKKL